MSVTQEQPVAEAPVVHEHGVRWWIVAVIGVVALGIGALIGSMFDNGDETSDVVMPNGLELTDRQQERVELVRSYMAALQDSDAVAAASYMTTEAVWQNPLDARTVTPMDGSFQEFLEVAEANSWAITVDEPLYAAGDSVIETIRVPERGLRYVWVFSFDVRDGELLIESVIEVKYLLEPEAR